MCAGTRADFFSRSKEKERGQTRELTPYRSLAQKPKVIPSKLSDRFHKRDRLVSFFGIRSLGAQRKRGLQRFVVFPQKHRRNS